MGIKRYEIKIRSEPTRISILLFIRVYIGYERR